MAYSPRFGPRRDANRNRHGSLVRAVQLKLHQPRPRPFGYLLQRDLAPRCRYLDRCHAIYVHCDLQLLVCAEGVAPQVAPNARQNPREIRRAARACEPIVSAGEAGIARRQLVFVSEAATVAGHSCHDGVVQGELHYIGVLAVQLGL
jgi:hypothetical protein